MRRHTSMICLSLVGVGLMVLAAPALAGEDLPFEFVKETSQRISETGNGWTAIGTGHATHMGDVTFVIEVKRHGDRYVSWRTIEAANGDLLFLYNETVYDPDVGRAVGTYTITGGTGRFAGATGTGTQVSGIGSVGTISF